MPTTVLGAIPQPPTHLEVPEGWGTFFNIFLLIPLAAALILALRHIATGRGPVLLLCLCGGLLASVFEPVVDILGLVYLREHGAIGTFTIFDRTMPLYILFVYPWYVGGLGYLAYRLYSRGVTTRDLFTLWAVDFCINMCLESPGILADVYGYYGHQPLNPWGWPFWWGFVNPVMPMLSGALVYKLKPHLDRPWKLLAIIPLFPMADGMANGGAAWPVWITLNQENVPHVVTTLAAFATLGLAALMVYGISLAVARPVEEVGSRRPAPAAGSRVGSAPPTDELATA